MTPAPDPRFVRVHRPPGERCRDGQQRSWMLARDARGSQPFRIAVEGMRRRFPSQESELSFMTKMKERMALAAAGALDPEFVTAMACAPGVLELKLDDWVFAGGRMQTRIFFAEPADLPTNLLALTLLMKRPGPIGVDKQTVEATKAGVVLAEMMARNDF